MGDCSICLEPLVVVVDVVNDNNNHCDNDNNNHCDNHCNNNHCDNDDDNHCTDGTDGTDGTYTLNCSHKFHRACIIEWLKHQHTCPLCRQPIDADTQYVDDGIITQDQLETLRIIIRGICAASNIIERRYNIDGFANNMANFMNTAEIQDLFQTFMQQHQSVVIHKDVRDIIDVFLQHL